MISVLLAQIEPTDRHLDALTDFSNGEDPLQFEVSVFNGSPLRFRVDKKFYEGSDSFHAKVEAIHEELDVEYGGHAVEIDRYPRTRYRGGAMKVEFSGMPQYDFEADFEISGCECLVLSVPGQKPIPLSGLRFTCDGVGAAGFSSEAIIFRKEAVLSVTLPFGEVKGIALTHCCESALNPDAGDLQYTMCFQRHSLPGSVLQKLL